MYLVTDLFIGQSLHLATRCILLLLGIGPVGVDLVEDLPCPRLGSRCDLVPLLTADQSRGVLGGTIAHYDRADSQLGL